MNIAVMGLATGDGYISSWSLNIGYSRPRNICMPFSGSWDSRVGGWYSGSFTVGNVSSLSWRHDF